MYLWQEEQLSLPSPLPSVTPKHRQESVFSYRYYYNVCTFGYSSAFWTEKRWVREVDWMAMNGINFPLAFVGQEYVWEQVFADLGMNETAVRDSWFSNAAFLPWNRMGNINNWTGPLSRDFIVAQVLLQKQILQRQRSFGMKAILPGFAGHVPPAFPSYFPSANISQLVWDPQFGPTYTLSPQDPLFHLIGNAFVRKVSEIFGSDSFYNADPFNEMDPTSNSTSYLSSVSSAIYRSMSDADPNAVWVLQGWFLLDGWWQPPQTKAFLDGAPDDRLIVLDLWAEVEPYWSGHSNFYGKQFIWCMLHDFGGRSGLYAAFDAVNTGLAAARQQAAGNLVGIGLTPEAIDTNPVIYDFVMEATWNNASARDVDTWIVQWATRRYGRANAAAASYWLTLRREILNCNTGQMAATASPLVMRPRLSLPSGVGCCATLQQYYDPSKLDAAWSTLLSAADLFGGLDTYRNDLVEITRQVLGDYAFIVYGQMVAAFNASDKTGFAASSEQFLELFDDLDLMLGTQPSYLLGVWAERASMWGVTPAESALHRKGALLQVTTWGPATLTNDLHEYAFKLWNGLVGEYYRARWELFVAAMGGAIDDPSSLDMAAFHSQLFVFESGFASSQEPFATVPQGDAVLVSRGLRAKYSNITWPPSAASMRKAARRLPLQSKKHLSK